MTSTCMQLKYSEYSATLNDGLHHLLGSEINADVTFAIEGRFIKAHQIILSIFSTYFQELFATNPCPHPIFFMKDVSYPVMKHILGFIYAGEVQIAEDDVPSFIATANALKIKSFVNVQNSPSQEVIENDETERNNGNNHQIQMQIKECLKEKPLVLKCGRNCKKKQNEPDEEKLELHEKYPKIIKDEEEEETNNMLSHNITINEEQLQHLKWVKEENPLEITESQLQFPLHIVPDEHDEEEDDEKLEISINNQAKGNIAPALNKVDENGGYRMECLNVSDDSLQDLVWVSEENSMDIADPQTKPSEVSEPIGSMHSNKSDFNYQQSFQAFFNSANQSDRPRTRQSLKDKEECQKQSNDVIVSFIRSKKESIIIDNHRYYKGQWKKSIYDTFTCTKPKCNAKIFLTHDGIFFQNEHTPECLTRTCQWNKSQLLMERSYRRLSSIADW